MPPSRTASSFSVTLAESSPGVLSSFKRANINEVVDRLTTDEAISLIAGVGFWWTAPIPRLGIPSVKVSDGPNGVRGGHFFNGTPANCIPCATALGATWDPELVTEIAENLLAPETKQRAASVILAPTCNIQRNPLGGRSFESFTEDPHLSGILAAAYVNGIQSQGVASCIKHFVANDQEHERQGSDSRLGDRALREVYLMPFMIAQRLSRPQAFMTSYNKVNGLHASENPGLLQGILRKEWKSDALVMSDWFGVYSVTESINASLDLEMPGVTKWRTHDKVNRAITARKTTVRQVKERAKKVLELVKALSATNSEVIDGDGEEQWSHQNDVDSALMRKVAGNAIVLLKNQGNILPLDRETLKKVAIIGPNAKALVPSGGGSASLKTAYLVTPYDGIASMLTKETEVTYHEGCVGYLTLPSLDARMMTPEGKSGWTATFHSNDQYDRPIEEAHTTLHLTETNVFISNSAPLGLTERWTLKLRGKLRPVDKSANWQFGLTVAGRAKLYLDGELIIDNWTRQRRGESFFMTGTEEERGQVRLEAGRTYDVYVEFMNVRGPAEGDEDEVLLPGGPGIRLGGAEVLDPEGALAEAEHVAKAAEVAIVVVGLNGDWESEGYDRKTLALPGLTDDLVRRVAKANPKTIVVCQSGSAVTMPWVDDVPSLMQSWYGGNENGNAIADVIFGRVNPGGKMPMTFPKRLEDVPAHGHIRAENGKVWYSEDLYVGYKGYQHKNIEPLFPFGFGLSYTTFSYDEVSVTSKPMESVSDFIKVTVKITNIGSVVGSEVVQLYITLPKGHLTHPEKQLRAFKKVKDLGPGMSAEVELVLDKYAVSYWDDVPAGQSLWRADQGTYVVRVGGSSDKLVREAKFEVGRAFEWSGL
ncbi:hypothetical protein FRB94_011835 [Tulasnella sp. JGI-2019a]|nr:hypothetical protein FRB93_002281 [Tulasnella sp. JGI-2019a]KAG9014657.1 hypothetical protein FRB94_011835 [Tulasnella sp. JGI-2019a]KAG9038991.1 hypothetical protein FRB95_013669 [Tulasnella sp. JGI-2019a]